MKKGTAVYLWYAFVSLIVALITGCISQAVFVKDQNQQTEEKYMTFYSFMSIALVVVFSSWVYVSYS